MTDGGVVFLDNEKWVYDARDQRFEKGDGSGIRLEMGDIQRRGYHLAHLEIALIRGYPYYHDVRLREFRRVGEPSFSLGYDQFDLLPEQNRVLKFPTGERFRNVMRKEAEYWRRRREASDSKARRHADKERNR